MEKIEITDIEEVGSELTEDNYGLVAGGCGPQSCTGSETYFCTWVDELGGLYCGHAPDGDED